MVLPEVFSVIMSPEAWKASHEAMLRSGPLLRLAVGPLVRPVQTSCVVSEPTAAYGRLGVVGSAEASVTPANPRTSTEALMTPAFLTDFDFMVFPSLGSSVMAWRPRTSVGASESVAGQTARCRRTVLCECGQRKVCGSS